MKCYNFSCDIKLLERGMGDCVGQSYLTWVFFFSFFLGGGGDVENGGIVSSFSAFLLDF